MPVNQHPGKNTGQDSQGAAMIHKALKDTAPASFRCKLSAPNKIKILCKETL